MVVWCKNILSRFSLDLVLSGLIAIQFLIKVLIALSVSFADAYRHLLAAKSHDMATKPVVIDSRRLQNYSTDHSEDDAKDPNRYSASDGVLQIGVEG